MPLANFRIREVSSEDKKHSAQNLIKESPGLKWKTRLVGESQAYVILELHQPEKIIGIDIGNEHSAFIGVGVAKSVFSTNNFMDLLITSSFMTPTESKNSTNLNRVICFTSEVMVPNVASESWSLIKITCTQPFNKHVQYGLSFIKLRIAADSSVKTEKLNETIKVPVKSPPKLSLKLREESPDFDLNSPSGSNLFKRWQNSNRSTLVQPIQIKPTLNIKETPTKNLNNKKHLLVDANDNSLSKNSVILKKEEKLLKKEPIEDLKKKDNSYKKTEEIKTSKLLETPTKGQLNIENKTLLESKSKKCRPFNQLMNKVVLVISGIQNPDRAELRNKALALGAKYKVNWDSTCTHLICAFKNTPKYNEVLGKGKIVKRSWIEDSFNQRKYLPWRRYALVTEEGSKDESDEEVCEEVKSQKDEIDKTNNNESKETLNNSLNELDESVINGVQNESLISSSSQNSKNTPRKRSIYEESTDEEDYLPKKCAKKV